MKRVLNKWQIVWRFGRDWMRLQPGWYTAAIGIVNYKQFPPEGEYPKAKRDYRGFMVNWRFWLPFEAGR
jgi:hypothetical protein